MSSSLEEYDYKFLLQLVLSHGYALLCSICWNKYNIIKSNKDTWMQETCSTVIIFRLMM